MKPRKSRQLAALSLDLRIPAPPREKARDVLNDLVTLCLSHDPRELAAPVENIKGTRETLAILTRWFERYAAALPPGIQ